MMIDTNMHNNKASYNMAEWRYDKYSLQSWYQQNAQTPAARPTLTGEETCDVCVIGGGLTGVSAAFSLARAGYDVTLVEAETVGSGASGRNGGHLSSGYHKEMDWVARHLGRGAANTLWQTMSEANRRLATIRKTEGIECHYRPGYLHVATRKKHLRTLESMTKEQAIYGKTDGVHILSAQEIKGRIHSPAFIGGLIDPEGGHIDPYVLTQGLAQKASEAGARLFEHSPVLAISRKAKGYDITLDHGKISCQNVVLAAHRASLSLAPKLKSKVLPVWSYIAATKPLSPSDALDLIPGKEAVCDLNNSLTYFRIAKDKNGRERLIFGGDTWPPIVGRWPDPIQQLGQRLRQVFPHLKDLECETAWGGPVAVTLNRLPMIGRLDQGLYISTGYSGQGIALSSFAGTLIAEALKGDTSRLDVFDKIKHPPFPGGQILKTPVLTMGRLWLRLCDII